MSGGTACKAALGTFRRYRLVASVAVVTEVVIRWPVLASAVQRVYVVRYAAL